MIFISSLSIVRNLDSNKSYQNTSYKLIVNIFFVLGKIVVYSGYPYENGKNAEIIDLLNPEATCDTYGVLYESVDYAFGGRVANEFVVCGGNTDEGRSKNCYKVGETSPFVELIQPRSSGSSVVLSNDTLILLGKFYYFNHLYLPHPTLLLWVFLGGYLPGGSTKTTELVTTNPPTVREGPQLPENFVSHCSVLVEDKVFLIGGLGTENKLLMIDLRTSAMTYKSELNHGRYYHACAQITGSNGKKLIVVSGGYDGINDKSSEIYHIDNDVWKEGKNVSPVLLIHAGFKFSGIDF